MILFPAIDLKEGRCVRLVQGDFARSTTFNEDPVAQAREFAREGATHLHVVDLDGALNGTPVHAPWAMAIQRRTTGVVQQRPGLIMRATCKQVLHEAPPEGISAGEDIGQHAGNPDRRRRWRLGSNPRH